MNESKFIDNFDIEPIFGDDLDKYTDKLILLFKDCNIIEKFILDQYHFQEIIEKIRNYNILIKVLSNEKFLTCICKKTNLFELIIKLIIESLDIKEGSIFQLFTFFKNLYHNEKIKQKKIIIDLIEKIHEFNNYKDFFTKTQSFEVLDLILTYYNEENNEKLIEKMVNDLIFQYPFEFYEKKDYFNNNLNKLSYKIYEKWKDLPNNDKKKNIDDFLDLTIKIIDSLEKNNEKENFILKFFIKYSHLNIDLEFLIPIITKNKNIIYSIFNDINNQKSFVFELINSKAEVTFRNLEFLIKNNIISDINDINLLIKYIYENSEFSKKLLYEFFKFLENLDSNLYKEFNLKIFSDVILKDIEKIL
ncbi:MAG: hypothetical protein ACTSRP_11970, partial [Candidatus Helarchaeota archaeon]